MVDYEKLLWDEVDDLTELLSELSDEELDHPSLCDGWRVRDVYGHMAMGHTMGFGRLIALGVRSGFSPAKSSHRGAVAFADARSSDETKRFWKEVMVGTHPRRGAARMISFRDGFFDHLVHHQDVRRPLDRPRTIPEDRLAAALDAIPSVHSPFFSTKKPTKGLSLRATDVDWSWGSGPEVAGPAEALIMACSGRSAALPELSGEGVEQLASRVGG